MKFRTIATAVAVTALSASLAAWPSRQSGQVQQPPAKPEQKPDAKPAPSLAGKWTMIVDAQQGPLENALELKQDGKKLTGTLTSQMGTAPIEGEFADGKLTLSMTMEGSGGSFAITFTGTLKEDGTLAGSLSGNNGQFELTWRASRVK